jgi:hypothetical protein
MKTADIGAALAGTQFLISMVETRLKGRNGDSGADITAPRELEKIEGQIGRLESLDGQTDEVRKEIEDLRGRVESLRKEMSHREAWIKTELARHPQRPYFLDYVEKIFTDWSEIHGDRRYADDDLTMGSIDPYQVFRIFHEIHTYAWETGAFADVAYMVDQSHNLKGKMEAMIQTVCMAQELYAKAAIVDHARLAPLQQSCSLVEAEETLRGAFWFDVRPAIREWRNLREVRS